MKKIFFLLPNIARSLYHLYVLLHFVSSLNGIIISSIDIYSEDVTASEKTSDEIFMKARTFMNAILSKVFLD